MAAEGEKPAPRSQENAPRGNNGPRGNGQRRNRRGGNGQQQRFGRQQQWDPRRSEPREPAYVQAPKSEHRPVVIQKKRSFTGLVAALLGKKKEPEAQG
jgi:hypothetical protein